MTTIRAGMSLEAYMKPDHKKPERHNPFEYMGARFCNGAFRDHAWEPASAWTAAQARALAFQAFRQFNRRRPRLGKVSVQSCSACRMVRLDEAPDGRRPVRVLIWPEMAYFEAAEDEA